MGVPTQFFLYFLYMSHVLYLKRGSDNRVLNAPIMVLNYPKQNFQKNDNKWYLDKNYISFSYGTLAQIQATLH